MTYQGRHIRSAVPVIARLVAGFVSVGLLFSAVKVAADGPVRVSHMAATHSAPDPFVERGRYLAISAS